MPYLTRYPALSLALSLSLAALPGATARAAPANHPRPPDAGNIATSPGATSPPVLRYTHRVSQQLHNRFGTGRYSRNLYCSGPSLIGFNILPSGRVADVHVLRHSIPGTDAALVAQISNMTFPQFPADMPAHPVPIVYRYGISPLARPSLALRSNCR